MELEVAFRIMASDLEPDEISSSLGLIPSLAHRHGDPRGQTGKMRDSMFSEGLWSIDSGRPRSADLDEHLTSLLVRLEPKKTFLWILKEREWQMDFFVGVFCQEGGNDGMSIGPAIAERVAQLGAFLDFDIYAH